MSRSHRSLKLLNKASKDSNNKLILFTELDHTLQANDLVYINSGYYDNIDSITYINSWSIGDNIFNNSNKKPYKVLSVNFSNNSFTLDITIPGVVFHPYAKKTSTTNVIASPTDTTDLAYNNIRTSTGVYDMYKGVYVSQYSIITPKIKSGTVYNGVFGTDKIVCTLSNTVNPGYQVFFKHGAVKNGYMQNASIDSKSFNSGLITNKYELNQKLVITPIITSLDNNGQGYSSFEKCVIANSQIVRSEIENQRANNINVIACDLLFPVIGSKNTIEAFANVLSCSTGVTGVANPTIRNITFFTPFFGSSINHGTIDGSAPINLKSSNVTYIAPNKLRFPGVNNIFGMNNTLKTLGTSTGYISGFIGINNKPLEALNGACKIVTNNYTYGTANTALIEIEFTNLTDPALLADFMANYVNGFNVVYEPTLLNNLLSLKLYYNNSTSLTSSLINVTSNSNLYINCIGSNIDFNGTNPITIYGGFYTNINLIDNIAINSSNQSPTYITDCFQYSDEFFVPVYNTTIINSSYTYSANMNNCIINSGSYSNSIFYNTEIKTKRSQNTFLYNSIINDYCKIDTNVDWEYIKYDINIGIAGNYQVSGPGFVFVNNTNFAGRIFPIITGHSENLPITLNNYHWNLNNKKTTDVSNYLFALDTQAIGVQPFGNLSKIHASPIIHHNNALPGNNLNPTSGSPYTYALYDLGTLRLTGFNFFPQYTRNKLLFAKKLSTNPTFNTVLNNVITNNITVNDPYLVLSSPIYTVDASQAYNELYFKKTPTLSRANTMASIFTNPPVKPNYAVVTQMVGYASDLNFVGPFFGSLTTLTPYNGTPGSINVLPNGDYEIYTEALMWANIAQTIPATLVPSCYAEVEYTKIEICNNVPPLAFTILNAELDNSSRTYGDINFGIGLNPNDRVYDISKSWSNSNPFDPSYAKMTHKMQLGGIPTRIEISVWITEHYNDVYKNSGKKIHKILEYWFS